MSPEISRDSKGAKEMFPPSTRSADSRRSFHLRRAALLSLLIFLAPAAVVVRAQAIGAHRGDIAGTGGTTSIRGRIISSSGRLPDTRLRVTLDHSDSGSRSTVADADGNFNFNGLENGSYRLTIEAGKEFETAHESVYIESGKPIYNVIVNLRIKPEANPAFAGVPKPAVDLYLKATEAGRKGENGKAVEHLKSAIELHPKFGPALGELGVQYMKANQLDKAIESFRSALEVAPDDPVLRLNYGMALLEKKDFPEAEKHLRQALTKMNTSPQAHMYLGVALMRTGKHDEAEKEFKQAIKLGGDTMGQAHYYLGGIYWAKKEYKRAADELETYLKLKPDAPDAERIRTTIKDLRSKS
jgi:Flp pilus assembly protein TadD